MKKIIKKSTPSRQSIDKMSTTNSTTKIKETIDPYILKLNSHIFLNSNNVFNSTHKKPKKVNKKNKSAITTPKSFISNTKTKLKNTPNEKFSLSLNKTCKQSPVATPYVFQKQTKQKLSRKSYDFIYQIGSGGFGSVWKVKNKKTNQTLAMKQILKAKVIMKKSVNSVINENILLNQLVNPFIINAVQSFQDREHLYLVMEYLRGGDLRYHMCYYEKFNEQQAKFIVACIVQSLTYIHSKGVIHRDIKPQNLVFQENGYLRLTDFGVARKLKQNNSQQTSGTPGYMSPEVICRMNHSFESDFFALGVIIYEIIMGHRPYLGDSRKQIREKILAHQAKIMQTDLPQDWSIDCVDFVNKLLKRNRQSRLGYNGIEELKSHLWMKSIDWKKLSKKQLIPPFYPGVVSESVQYQRQMENCEQTELDQETVVLLRTPQIQSLFKDYDDVAKKTGRLKIKNPR